MITGNWPSLQKGGGASSRFSRNPALRNPRKARFRNRSASYNKPCTLVAPKKGPICSPSPSLQARVVFVTLQPILIAQTAPQNNENDENVTGGQNARSAFLNRLALAPSRRELEHHPGAVQVPQDYATFLSRSSTSVQPFILLSIPTWPHCAALSGSDKDTTRHIVIT